LLLISRGATNEKNRGCHCEPPREKSICLDGEAARVAESCRPLYEHLYNFRIRVEDFA